jgi:hypothetical protein
MPNMPGAINGARRVIEPVIETHAVEVSQAAIVGEAHVPFLATDGSFTPHEAVSLAGAERAIAHAHGDAFVLEGASLVDARDAMVELRLVLGDSGALLESWSLLRSSLSKAKSGG